MQSETGTITRKQNVRGKPPGEARRRVTASTCALEGDVGQQLPLLSGGDSPGGWSQPCCKGCPISPTAVECIPSTRTDTVPGTGETANKAGKSLLSEPTV